MPVGLRLTARIFQFPPLREGRPASWRRRTLSMYFNSRPSARGDTKPSRTKKKPSKFQFPPLREGRLNRVTAMVGGDIFQFPPLREGRLKAKTLGKMLDISIPAPPRGATSALGATGTARLFQFPPLREGRQGRGLQHTLPLIFQFPPLREGRQRKICGECEHHSISIPAPPRGATTMSFISCVFISFQFPPLREGRREADAEVVTA